MVFHLCWFYFCAVLVAHVPPHLVFEAEFGIRLYRFLITAFLSNLFMAKTTPTASQS